MTGRNNNNTTANNLFTPVGPGGAYLRTGHLFLLRWQFYLGVALLTFPLLLALQWTAGLIKQDEQSSPYDAPNDEHNNRSKRMYREVIAWLVEFLLFTLVDIFAKGTLTIAALEHYTTTTRTSPLDCARRALRHVCTLFCTGLLLEIIVVMATLIVVGIAFPFLAYSANVVLIFIGVLLILSFLVALVYAFVPLLLLYPVILQETARPIASLRRCYTIALERRIYLGYTVFLVVFVKTAIRIGLGFLPVGLFLRSVLSCLPVVLAMPFLTLLSTVVYMDLRVKSEGLTAEELTNKRNEEKDETEITQLYDDDLILESSSPQVV